MDVKISPYVLPLVSIRLSFLAPAKWHSNAPSLFISKPTRQKADNCLAGNYLIDRILRQKTRQSDSFSEILVFTKNQRYGQLLLISTNLN